MKVIIAGCGRLGKSLAYTFDKQGVDVTVMDSDPDTFNSMYSHFSGKCLVGAAHDQRVLELAEMHSADAVVACTSSDETNALVARIARNIYHVPKAIARLYDVRKAAIYNTLGVQVISTTAWGVSRIQEMLSYHHFDTVMDFGNSEVKLVRFEAPLHLAGAFVEDIARLGEISVVAVTRNNSTFIPVFGTVFERGDILHIVALATAISRLKRNLGF